MSSESDLLSLMQTWDGEALTFRYEPRSQSWMIIALHSSQLGPATGGTRMKPYPNLAAAALDATRLASGMTKKWAALGLPIGGGKAVLAIPNDLSRQDRTSLLHEYGALLSSLDGCFRTGADLGTTPDDMALLARSSSSVLGIDPRNHRALDPGPYTAAGVLTSIEAAVRHCDLGSGSLEGLTVLVQGVGDVGEPLSRSLAEAGAHLVLSDLETSKVERLAQELGATTIDGSAVADFECDVYAPCAIGATLNQQTIPRLRCRIVAGSANNQLQQSSDAARLHERGILYLPDYIINAGGALAFALIHDGELDSEVLETRVRALGETVESLLEQAAQTQLTPHQAARRRVEQALAK